MDSKVEQTPNAPSLAHRAGAAAGASVVSAIVVNPLDVAKTRIQAQPSNFFTSTTSPTLLEKWNFATCGPTCVRITHPSTPPSSCAPDLCGSSYKQPYTGTLDALKRISRAEGTAALWRGTDVALMMAIPMVGIYLPLYDYLVEYIRKQDTPLVRNNNNNNNGIAAAAPLVAGVVARTVAVFCTAPFELLRTRVQAGGMVHLHSSSSSSSMSSSRRLLSHHLPLSGGSISRLWTGVGATLARDVPFSGLYWAMVEPIRSTLLPDYNNSSQQRSEVEIATANVVAGGLSGWIAGAVTTPLDVVKTRTQLLMGEKHPLIATLREIGTTQGAGGLFQGWGARAARAAPACAIVLSAYEMLKHWH